MKKEAIFVKPTYKYDGELREHPIERLEFIDVPENIFERVGMSLKEAGVIISKRFSVKGRS